MWNVQNEQKVNGIGCYLSYVMTCPLMANITQSELSYTKCRVFTITEENRSVTQWHVLLQLVYTVPVIKKLKYRTEAVPN